MSLLEEHTDEGAVQDIIAQQQAERRMREAICNEMTSLFDAIDRCILLMRVYPHGHPLIDTFLHQTHERFSTFIKNNGYLFFYVEATELKTEDNDVFFSPSLSQQESFIWYAAAADGVVSIQFDLEMSVRVFTRFIQVINRTSQGHVPVDDDTVTLMWEQSLVGIDVHAIEGFIDVGDQDFFGKHKPQDVQKMVLHAALEPAGEAREKLQTIFASAPDQKESFGSLQSQIKTISSPNQGVSPEMIADAFRVDTAWVKQLSDEWDSGNDLEYRLIESLLSIIRANPTSEQSENASETIMQVASQLLDSEDYEATATVLSLLKQRIDDVPVDDEYKNPRQALLEILSDPMRLEALIYQAQKYPDQRPQLITLLALLDHDSVQGHILQSLGNPKKEVLSTRTLVDILIAVTSTQNQHKLLNKDYTAQDVYIERMMEGLRDRDLAPLTVGPRLFVCALNSPTISVRKNALEVATDDWYSPKTINDAIKPLMSDEDDQVRRLAFDVIRKYDLEGFRREIAQIVDAGDFFKRPVVEVRYMMRLYLDVFPDRLNNLYPFINHAGWFDEYKRRAAIAVGTLLLSMNDDGARQIITKRAKSIKTNPAHKKAYRELLERFVAKPVNENMEQSHVQ